MNEPLYPNSPRLKVELVDPIADLTIDQIRTKMVELQRDSDELRGIKATLYLNCGINRALWMLGCSYDETKRVDTNLYNILTTLHKKVEG